jgi:hypothetical protein
MITSNSDLPGRLSDLLETKTIDWVIQEQPVGWQPGAWKAYWQSHQLPCSQVLRELESEIREHGKIRRKFIFDTYRDRPPTELFIAVMAWGLGDDHRGAARAGRVLSQGNAETVIRAVVDATRHGGAASGYGTYYTRGNKLRHLDVAFITKLIHFAGYESEHRPRPLIYDKLVATAITRLPTAPLLPDIEDKVTTVAYEQYCQWAHDTAMEHGTALPLLPWTHRLRGGRGSVRSTV